MHHHTALKLTIVIITTGQRILTNGRIACHAVIKDWMIPCAACCYWQLNDPFCCEQRKRLPMLLKGPNNAQKLPLPMQRFRPPSKTWFLGPTVIQTPQMASQLVQPQQNSQCFWMGWTCPKNCPFPFGYLNPI